MPGTFYIGKQSRAGAGAICALLLLRAVGAISAAPPDPALAGPHYTGRVIYRGTKTSVPGVLVELVEAEDDGKPTDEVLGSGRADAEGRFVVPVEKSSDAKILALVVVAVRESAESGGDRRGAGYEVKTHEIQLGWLSRPNPHGTNTISIERRRPGHATDSNE